MFDATLNRQQARELDRRASEEFGVPSIVLMENAGRGTAEALCDLGITGRVVICCGKGNNGGDGFVIARHLDLAGVDVQVVCWHRCEEFPPDAAANYRMVEAAKIPLAQLDDGPHLRKLDSLLAGAEWIVDALLGTGAQGEPRPPYDQIIDRVNSVEAWRLAVDVPSGLDCDTGAVADRTIRADHTCTFVAPKPGLLVDAADRYVGRLHVVQIGAPRCLIEEMVTPREEA